MKLLLLTFFFSLLLGQLGGMQVARGVVVYAHEIVLAIILVVAFRKKAFRRSMTGSRLVRPIAAFVVVGAISLLANSSQFSWQELARSSLYLVRWVFYAGLYFVAACNVVKKKNLLKALFGAGVGLSVLGLLQFFLYPDLRNLMYLGWDPHYYRLFSTLFDPNFTGIIIVLTILLAVDLKKIHFVILAFIALLLTYSRSSYLALLTGVFFGVLVKSQWKKGLFVVLLVLLAIVYLPHPGREALSLDRFDSTVSRLVNWKETFSLISQKPLFGWGFNTLPILRQRETRDITPSRAGAGVDNSLLFVAATTGIVGLGAYLWLLLRMGKIGRKPMYLASLAAVFVHSLFVNSLFYPWVMVWMWILAGASISDT